MKLRYAFVIWVVFIFQISAINGLAKSKREKNNSDTFFKIAQPIWPADRQFEKNLSVRFIGDFEIVSQKNVVLKITGSSLYRIYLNEKFIGHGPARAAHNYYRVDELDITDKSTPGKNYLTIEVAGYNVNSFYLLDQPSFLQAEVISDDKVVLATGKSGFQAFQITERVQKVPRYSFQRPFTEVYDLSSTRNATELKCENVENKQLIQRRINYSEFLIKKPIQVISSGKISTGHKQKKYWKDRAVVNIGKDLGGFPESDLEINPAIELQEIMEESRIEKSEKPKKLYFPKNSFKILDFGLNNSGFIGAQINCKKPCTVYFTFDEILTENNDVDFKRLGCINAVTYNLKPGDYSVESFEPYTFRYLKIIVVNGECEIENVYLREYVNPDVSKATFHCNDERLNRIYKAGVETFKQNVVDIFMDCPSRERAGWLCDSYFSSRVAADLMGNTLIEKNFFENFLLPDSFRFLPDGMLPMCYPADHYNGQFIPNWAMWFVIELEEYLYRSNDREMVDALQPKVLNLINYFEQFKNNDGLLESLDSWIFVEWSRANRFVHDVNYPTNMLYSAMLEAAAKMYQLPELQQQSNQIKSVIQKQSFNGDFFVDNAIREENGELKVTNNTTEVCQYYAFYFNVATPTSHPELWRKLVDDFGPERKNNNAFPEVHFANAFIGNYLRLELLSRYKESKQILTESIDFFDYMAERTGTLWEHISTSASCNHGFASHIVHLFYRDVLGIHSISSAEKIVTVQFSDIEILTCKGQIPLGDEFIQLEWKKNKTKIEYKLNVPQDYKVEIQNLTDFKLVEI